MEIPKVRRLTPEMRNELRKQQTRAVLLEAAAAVFAARGFHAASLDRRGYQRGGPVLGLGVQDLEEMGKLLEREGARALGPAHAIPGGRARDFEDPEGYVLELVQLDKPPAEV